MSVSLFPTFLMLTLHHHLQLHQIRLIQVIGMYTMIRAEVAPLTHLKLHQTIMTQDIGQVPQLMILGMDEPVHHGQTTEIGQAVLHLSLVIKYMLDNQLIAPLSQMRTRYQI